MSQIRIDCPAVYLREYAIDDLESLHALTWQPEIYEFLPGWNVSREQREEWFVQYELEENARFMKAVSDGGDVGDLRLRLGIIEISSGEFIGWCCTGLKDELPDPEREIMYAISNKHRNKGYTTQAVKGMVEYLFQHTKIDSLVALAHIRNIASMRVIEKSGFIFKKRIKIEDESFQYYKMSKPLSRPLEDERPMG
ncbi:GNAT family N-acetyltransferase [Paenibacillus sp. MMO-58]|uniref:GNAT family N-acetyltransferase n=1 Tax=Paenibacillus sp. MMO-58 TaxID=3081290 RepID=UPI00301B40BE